MEDLSDEQLSPIEAIMWRVGEDPTLRLTVGALIILDGPPDHQALLLRLTDLKGKTKRLRLRPDGSTVRGRPFWIEDDDLAADQHLRVLSVAPPGSTRQALDLTAVLDAVPFDPERSPWDVTLIEGLEGGRAALYARAHHALTDGIGGIRLLTRALDQPAPSRVVAEPPPPTKSKSAGDGQPLLGTFTVTINVPRAVFRFMDNVNTARDTVRDFHPIESGVHGIQRALEAANSVSRQLMVTGGPLASRPAARSMLSRFEVISVEGARSTALALGGSRNDLLIAAAAAGLGRYYDRLGQRCPDLRLATPTSQRRHDKMGGNWFAPTRLEVPTAVDRPAQQFGAVAGRLAQARREPALQMVSALATTIGHLPSRLLVSGLHAQADSVDFAATAVPGWRGQRQICGARVEASYPLGPRLGCPVNITGSGNRDRLDVGIALDPSVLTEPDMLVECLEEAFASFTTGAPVSRRGSRPAK